MNTLHLAARLKRGAGLDDEGLHTLVAAVRRIDVVPARDPLALDAAPSDAALLLLDGWACRARILDDGKRQITDVFLPGDIIRLDAAVRDDPLEAVSACSVGLVAQRHLTDALDAAPALRRALQWSALQGETILRETVVNIGQRRGPSRVAHLICEVRARLHAAGVCDPASDAVPWRLTQADMGDALGLSTVHLNRMLGELRDNDLIVFGSRQIRIPNPSRLAAFCGFRPGYLAPRLPGRTIETTAYDRTAGTPSPSRATDRLPVPAEAH